MMDNGLKEKLFEGIELAEGVSPLEYDGTEVNIPVFAANKQYGMFVMLDRDETNERVMKMFEVMGQLIPIALSRAIIIVHQFGKTEDEKLVQSIGWKFMPSLVNQLTEQGPEIIQ